MGFLGLSIQRALAADVTITVTIMNLALSLENVYDTNGDNTADACQWAIGSINVNDVVNTTTYADAAANTAGHRGLADGITVTNAGNTAMTVQLQGANSTPPAGSTLGGWTLGLTQGSNTFVLHGLFESAGATLNDSWEDNDRITTAAQSADAAIFNTAGTAGEAAAGDGVNMNVGAGGTALLFLQFSAPTSTTADANQQIVLTVNASAP